MKRRETDFEIVQAELALMIAKQRQRLTLVRRLCWLGFSLVLVGSGLVFWTKSIQPKPETIVEPKSDLADLQRKYLSRASDYQFLWTWEDYQPIKSAIASGDVTLDSIIKDYGKPSQIRTDDEGKTLYITYEASKKLGQPIVSKVSLYFEERKGEYYLSRAYFDNLPLPESIKVTTNPDGLTWTTETVDLLTVASESGQVGDSLEQVLMTFQVPSQLSITAFDSNEAPWLFVYYVDIPPRAGEVRLTFKADDQGVWRLVERYTSFYAGN